VKWRLRRDSKLHNNNNNNNNQNSGSLRSKGILPENPEFWGEKTHSLVSDLPTCNKSCYTLTPPPPRTSLAKPTHRNIMYSYHHRLSRARHAQKKGNYADSELDGIPRRVAEDRSPWPALQESVMGWGFWCCRESLGSCV